MQWSVVVKTACYKELNPLDSDWLYTRAASICYQLYMKKKSGVHELRKHYGGNKRFGTCTEHYRAAAGKNIRYVLKELRETANAYVGYTKFVSEDEANEVCVGQQLTAKGRTDMDRIARQVMKEKAGQK